MLRRVDTHFGQHTQFSLFWKITWEHKKMPHTMTVFNEVIIIDNHLQSAK